MTHLCSLRLDRPLVITLFLLIAVGCGGAPAGPALAPVRGQVTLDGKPVTDAVVEFIPPQGRPSIAITDSNGNYTLSYTASAPGAMSGLTYQVQVRTGRDAVSSEGVITSPAIPEKIPAKYNSKSELKSEVKPGDNVINFELASK